MYEFKVLDLKNSKSDSFNPIDNIEYLDLEVKARLLEILYNTSAPSFLEPYPMTITNFKIQEYRAIHSENVREFLTKNFSIPALFHLERQEYEALVLVVIDDCKLYDYSKLICNGVKKAAGLCPDPLEQ